MVFLESPGAAHKIVPLLRYGQTAELSFELLKREVESVTVQLEYLGNTKPYSLFLKKETSQDLPRISSLQYAQEGTLGTDRLPPPSAIPMSAQSTTPARTPADLTSSWPSSKGSRYPTDSPGAAASTMLTKPSAWRDRSPRGWPRSMATGSSTATSSRPTSSWMPLGCRS